MAPISFFQPLMAKFGAVKETVLSHSYLRPTPNFKLQPDPYTKIWMDEEDWRRWCRAFFSGLGTKKKPRKPWNQGKRRR